jgi:hypothetical protein
MADGGEEGLDALIARIPTSYSATTVEKEQARCCCGRPDCAFLKHNCSALDDLEKEVRTAAQLGQVRAFLYSCASGAAWEIAVMKVLQFLLQSFLC